MTKNPIPASALVSQSPETGASIPPLTLEIHSQGFTGKDQLVVEEGTTTTLFYYSHHSNVFAWDAELKSGGPQGRVVCRASKGFSSSFKVSLADGRGCDCVSTGVMAATHEFKSPSGTPYKWKNVGHVGDGAELALTDLTVPGKQKMVATWHTKNGLSRKRGILRISRDYMHELDIICTTALGMHALERARRHNR
ncbi:hypothetical protein JCM3766R1_005754 [Sporobolomyces carnicolor]